MSCTTTPGNRAVLLLARHSLDLPSPVDVAVVQRAFHALSREGRTLGLPQPAPDTVTAWFDDATFVAGSTLQGRARVAALKNLDEAWQEYRADPAALTGAIFHAWQHTPDLVAYEAAREPHTGFTVAFDCDGVLYDFNDAMRDWLTARGWDHELMPEPHTYSLKDSWGLPDEDLRREMPLAVRAGVLWHTGTSYVDGTDAARALGLAGHHILVNTARSLPGASEEARAATMTWLRATGIHPDGLHVADPESPASKLDAHWDLLLDDHPVNVRTALDAGRNAALVARRWNEDATDLPRVSFDEVPALVASLLPQVSS